MNTTPIPTAPIPYARTLPVADDLDTGGFWAAARRHELVVRACTGCGASGQTRGKFQILILLVTQEYPRWRMSR